MDFLRLRLPGLHQALRGALDSFSAFVSYLIGDTVPTVERGTQATEELEEVAAGKVIEEEAQEALEGFKSDQSERTGAPREILRCQEGSLAGEQTWGWRADSSPRPQAERQDPGSRKAAEGARGQEPNAPLKLEAEPGIHRDRSSNGAQEIWEPGEQEVSSGEPRRTCEQKEEKEVVVRSGMARGVESQPVCHREPEGNASTDRQNVTEDSKEIDWVAKEVDAETKGFGVKGADKEEERMVLMREKKAWGTQNPEAESEDWAVLGREAWTDTGREEADNLGIQEAEYGPDPEDSIPESTGEVWVLEEACKGGQQDELYEKRETRHQTQILETERTREMTEGQIARKEAVGDWDTQGSSEDEETETQDLATGEKGVSLEEEVQAEESPREKRSYGATEAVLALDKEAKGGSDLEESPGARPEESFMGEKNEATQMSQEVLRVKVTEGQAPELRQGSHTLTEQLEEGQKGQEETRRTPDLSPGGMLSLEDYHSPVGFAGPGLEARGNWRRDVDSTNTLEVEADAEEAGEEEIATGQAVEVQAEGGQESQQPEVPGWGAEAGLASMSQELKGSQGAETGQSVGESKPTESKAGEGEAAVPWEADSRKRRLEEVALSLQDSEDTQTSSSAAEIIVGSRIVGAEEGPEWEGEMTPEREFGRAWCSKGRGETGVVTKLEEATEKQSGQEVCSEGSAEEKATDYDVQASGGTGEAEQAQMGASVMAEGIKGIDGMTVGSQIERAEGSITIMETERLLGDQMLLEEEARGGLSRQWRVHNSGGETQELQDVENAEREAQRTEIQENDPEDLEDTSGQKRQQTHQIPTLAMPDFSESTGATASAPEDAHSHWNEALLPGSRLDVSVSRSRVLLSRNSSRRRSRPSLRRISAPEPQYDPPSPQPQEELSPEQSPLQPEETSELSATRPEGTPMPARKRVPGHGFGFAHPGMMQELQARLNRPKPQ